MTAPYVGRHRAPERHVIHWLQTGSWRCTCGDLGLTPGTAVDHAHAYPPGAVKP